MTSFHCNPIFVTTGYKTAEFVEFLKKNKRENTLTREKIQA